ncbi:phenylacetyl-CoA ligase [Amylocystis lapponica]|nr:phenylacetyl-CoA ligase [Amylocystis lapponica]
MTLFQSKTPWVPPPANLTLPQFMLDELHAHPTRPVRLADTPCIIDEESGKKVYLDELRSRTDALARSLSARFRIGDGDIVALYCRNHLDYVVCVWAVQRLGGAVALMNSALTEDELEHQLQITKPKLLIAHVESLSTALAGARLINLPHTHIVVVDAEDAPTKIPFLSLAALISEGQRLPPFVESTFRADEGKHKMALLCFSSGTTGKAKAVAMSHYSLICVTVQCAAAFTDPVSMAKGKARLRPGDVASGVLPLFHVYGFIANLQLQLYCGMTVVIMCKFNFERFLQSIERYRINFLMVVPPHVVLLCKHPATKRYDLSSVRQCIVGAAPLTAALTANFLELFPNTGFGQGLGMTETCSVVSVVPMDQNVGTHGSVGQLLAGTVAKVLKEDGSLAGVGEPGELWLKGPQVAMGYYKNEQATEETFIDGWMRSGDEVVIHENGDIFVTDRIKEFIKVKGFQVAPSELEGHLLGHPDVADAGVIGIPDMYSGEAPLAFIVLQPHRAATVQKDPSTAAEVRASLLKYVASAKSKTKQLTGGIVFVETIPKNASGKILRRVLREQAKNLPVQARL